VPVPAEPHVFQNGVAIVDSCVEIQEGRRSIFAIANAVVLVHLVIIIINIIISSSSSSSSSRRSSRTSSIIARILMRLILDAPVFLKSGRQGEGRFGRPARVVPPVFAVLVPLLFEMDGASIPVFLCVGLCVLGLPPSVVGNPGTFLSHVPRHAAEIALHVEEWNEVAPWEQNRTEQSEWMNE
jgi:hypothetical protein